MINCNDIPFSPRKLPIFYGWPIAALGTLGILMSVPGQTMGVAVFTDPLMEALRLSREKLALAYMVGTIGSASLLTFVGRLYDKVGARVLAPAAAMGLGLSVLGLSQCDLIARAVGGLFGQADSRVAGFITVLLGFFALRFSGQGVLTLASRNMIMKWFDRHRGVVSGFSGVVIVVGFALAIPLLDALVKGFGWRGAWRLTAGAVGLAFAALAALLFRDNPENCGLLPDGRKADDTFHTSSGVPVVHQFTLGQAVRTPTFWVFTLALSMFGLYMTSVSFHLISIFRLAGLPREQAVNMFLYVAVIACAFQIVGGWLSDHIHLKYLFMVMLAGMGLSMAGMATLSAGPALWAVILGNGVCQGLFGPLSGVTWPRLYGRKHLGAVSGLSMALVVFMCAVGPWLFSLAEKYADSYAPASWICLAVTAALLLASSAAANPQETLAAPREEE